MKKAFVLCVLVLERAGCLFNVKSEQNFSIFVAKGHNVNSTFFKRTTRQPEASDATANATSAVYSQNPRESRHGALAPEIGACPRATRKKHSPLTICQYL